MTTRWDVERAVLASGLPAPSRLIMMTLLSLTEAGGVRVPQRFTPSHNRLAELTGLSRRTVIEHTGALERAGWVAVRRAEVVQQRADKAPNQYALQIPASATAAHRSDLDSRPNQNQGRSHEIDAVITTIRQRTGTDVSPEWAAQVITHLLGDKANINNRTGYLIQAIRREPNPHQRFLPTPQPPPFRRDTPA